MSYRERERTRRKSIAQGAAQAEARRTGSASDKWWLTICRHTVACARCALTIRPGADLVFRRRPQESLCPRCADREAVQYTPSIAWERKRRGRGSAA